MSRPEDWFEIETAGTDDEGEAPATKTESVKQRMRARREQQHSEDAPPAETSEQQAGESIPQYDAETAAAALRKCKSTKTLDKLWKEVVADFRDSDRELPLEVEAAYDEMQEALSEREAQR